jgi:hypothetical protein
MSSHNREGERDGSGLRRAAATGHYISRLIGVEA